MEGRSRFAQGQDWELPHATGAMGKCGQAKQVFKSFGNNGRKIKTKAERELAKRYNPVKKTKPGMVPGSVLILLAGKFRGKRVVYLKTLDSGALLITGPYGVNRVPIRRCQSKMSICTSTKVDLKGVDVKGVTDELFARKKPNLRKIRKQRTEATMFNTEPEKPVVSEERKAVQKKINDALTKNLNEDMKFYLKTRFKLKTGMYPHMLKF